MSCLEIISFSDNNEKPPFLYVLIMNQTLRFENMFDYHCFIRHRIEIPYPFQINNNNSCDNNDLVCLDSFDFFFFLGLFILDGGLH